MRLSCADTKTGKPFAASQFVTSTNFVSPTVDQMERSHMPHQQRREINGVRAIFGGGEDEYLCMKEIAVVALFGGVVGLLEVLKRSYSGTFS